ncbi:MAG: hypothetical protein OSJ43_08305 [Oscillospiraceae bacterium]|nr:hypothetical protein [Oscillospiraceae bacterium]
MENAVIDFLEGWIEEYKINVERNSPLLPKSTLDVYKNNLVVIQDELEVVEK